MKNSHQFFVQDSNGVSQPNALITVRRDGDIVQIFGDKSGALKSNPFNATDDAYALFYADAGTYDIRVDYSGQSFTFVDVQIGSQTANNVVQRYHLTSNTSTVSKSGAVFGASVYDGEEYLPPDNGLPAGDVSYEKYWEITNNELGTISFTPAITASVGTPKTLTVYWYSETNDAVLDLQGGLITYYQGQFDDFIAEKDVEAGEAISGYKLKNEGLYLDGPTELEDGFEYVVFAATGKSYFAINPPYTTDPATYPDPASDTVNLTEQSYSTLTYTQEQAHAGDSQQTGLIYPVDALDYVQPNISTLDAGTEAVRVQGGQFTKPTLRKLISQDGMLFSASGLVTAQDLTSAPWSMTIGGIEYWLCDPEYFSKNTLSFRMFGAPTNGVDSDSPAIAAAVGCYPSIDFGIPVKSFKWDKPDVEYYLTTPIWCYELDEAAWNADSKINVSIKAPLDVTRPQEFIDIEGDRGHSYENKQAMFIFAARRRIQNPAQGFISAGGAANSPKMQNLFVQIDTAQVSMIYAPEVSGLQKESIRVWGGFRGIESYDCYASTFKNCVYDTMYQPHYITKGTSLVYTRCSAPRCNYGWNIKAQYSTMNSVTCDLWGRDTSGNQLQNSFAYNLRGSGWTLNSCGAEFGYGGVFNFGEGGVNTDITLNGGLAVCGAGRNDLNYDGQKTPQDFGMPVGRKGLSYCINTQITWNNFALRQVIQPDDLNPTNWERLPFEFEASNIVLGQIGRGFELQTLQYNDVRDFDLITTLDPSQTRGFLNVLSERDRPRAKALLTSEQVMGSDPGLITVIFDNKTEDRYSNYNETAGIFTSQVSGYYQLKTNITIETEIDTNWAYVAISSSNAPESIVQFSADSAVGDTINIDQDIYLDKLDTVRVGVRTANTAGKATIKQQGSMQIKLV